MNLRPIRWTSWASMALTLALAPPLCHAAPPAQCREITLPGEANAGEEWRATIGQGWVFRLVPIVPGPEGYTGWDMVLDREQPAGYPDALLLASPPWNSISERELGTTFGLRAQDAIGWNPRTFHLLTDAAAFQQSQPLFQRALAGDTSASQKLLTLAASASAGQLTIDDARIAPGLADPAPFAAAWALASTRVKHSAEPAASGRNAGRGELRWIRFTLSLWLPLGWKPPPGIPTRIAACANR